MEAMLSVKTTQSRRVVSRKRNRKMIFELKYKVYGNLNFDKTLRIKKYPYEISLFKEDGGSYISISKKIDSNSECIPTFVISDSNKEIKLPSIDSYQEMEDIINHIESFGALDNNLEYIDKLNVIMQWIPENENDHFSPFIKIKRNINENHKLNKISEDWLWSTVVHKNQLGELYIPFSFLRDGKMMFNTMKYQSSFCTFYMMLEYFFTEGNWGIKNDAYKRDKCLKNSLIKCLDELKKYEQHYKWLNDELATRKKTYNEEGLLFTLNMFRNEMSHAVNKYKNRNPFNEHKFLSLTFITMMICINVSIKKRLLPFVQPNNIDEFLER